MKNYLDFFKLFYIFFYNIIKSSLIYLYNYTRKINNNDYRLNFIKNVSYSLLDINVNYIKIIQALALNKDYLTEFNLFNCFDTLEIFINIFSLFYHKSIINIKSIFNENKKIMLGQIDMINEKNNIIAFSEKCKNFDYLHIPSVYNIENLFEKNINDINRYNKNFIIMDFVDGISINQLLTINNKELNNIFAKNILKFGLISIFFTNIIHYDLHPGNIIFKIIEKNTNKCLNYNDVSINDSNIDNYNYELGLIDFGIIFYPSNNSQTILYKFFNLVIIEKNYSSAAELMVKNCIRKKNSNLDEYVPIGIYNDIIKSLEKIFENYFGNSIEFDLDFFYIINNELNNYNLIFTNEFTKMILSLSIPTNLTKNLIDGKSITKTTSNLIYELSTINNLITF
jgi:predicted unusual protein kinase regulating ubiquinone biosynthesis (AarF/ABC1/UbiB family)